MTSAHLHFLGHALKLACDDLSCDLGFIGMLLTEEMYKIGKDADVALPNFSFSTYFGAVKCCKKTSASTTKGQYFSSIGSFKDVLR